MPGRKKVTTPSSGSGPGAGGYQQPSTPAAVSGPGQTSARTDGATPKVSLDGMQADSYGQRSELEGIASATGGAPGGSGAGETTNAPGGAAAEPGLMDAFRESEYPADGVPQSPYEMLASGIVPPDPDLILRVMYEQTRHPDIARLLLQVDGEL